MSALPKRYFTPEEYLALECKAESKSQYIDGESPSRHFKRRKAMQN